MRAIAVALAVAMLALPSLGTARGGDPVQPAQAPTLTVGALGQMLTRNVLNPLAWQDAYTMAVLARVYDTAVQRDPTTDAVVGRLAVGIDQDGDGILGPADAGAFGLPPSPGELTVFYNFTRARFHDATPVTAMDVLFSYHALALHPMAASRLLPLMDLGGGPGSNFTRDRWLWVLPADDRDGNPLTAALRFQLQTPYSLFPWAVLGIPILPRAVWEGTGGGRHGDFGLAIYPDADPRAGQGVPTWETTYLPFNVLAARSWAVTDTDVIGSGHYRFVTWVWRSFTQVDANPDYAFGPPRYDRILFKIYGNMQLLILALRAGEIDLILGSVPPEFLPDLELDPNVGLVSAFELFPAMLWYNLRRQPFGYSPYPPLDPQTDDPGQPFRGALSHLIDKRTIVVTLLQNRGQIADGMVSPNSTTWYNASLPMPPYSPSQAAAILDGEGWTDPPGPCQTDGTGCRSFPVIGTRAIEILTPQADFDPIIASAGAMLGSAARSIGVNVRSMPTSWGAIAQRLGARDFDLALLTNLGMLELDPWTLGRGDPDYLFDVLHLLSAAEGWNYGGVWDLALNPVLEGSRSEPDAASRGTLVRWAQGMVAINRPVEPLYYRETTYAYRRDRMTDVYLVGSTVFNYWTLQGPGKPVIILVAPPDGSLIRPGVRIDLWIADWDLASAEYRVDGGAPQPLPDPYDVSTTSWPDGTRVLDVTARDSMGNVATASYRFRVDGTPPEVIERAPEGAVSLPPTRVNVTFSEPVSQASAQAAFSISDGTRTWRADNGTFTWSADGRSFTFTPDEPFRAGSGYEVRLAETLTDLAGNPMGSDDTWSFTIAGPMPVLLGIAAALMLAAALAALLVLLLVRRRRRQGGTETPEKPRP